MLEILFVTACVGIALAIRPWRGVGTLGPPWPWLIWCAAMPWVWSSDRLVSSDLLQPLSGASLLVLMAGWPMAVLAMLAMAGLMAAIMPLDMWDVLHRLVWLGLVPGTLAMAVGAGVRRWLPHHLFVYILGRGFATTLVCTALAGLLSVWAQGMPPRSAVDWSELLVGRWLAAWGDAILTGMIVSIFVAFRPQWLATYSDRIYLPRS
jgi:uncharacterized membrane protein